MIAEIVSIGSNSLVAALVIWLIKSSTKREVQIAEKFANRPDFDQVDRRVDKVARELYEKEALLRKDFRGHTHEGNTAKVILK